jgi:plastocyanin domain-containing protein
MYGQTVSIRTIKGAKMKTTSALAVLLIFSGFTFADSAGDKSRAYVASVDKNGVQKIEVLGGKYFYKPDHIIVMKGLPVELIIKKEPGIVPHNIIINQPDTGMDINESFSTREKIIRFTPMKAGKYPFYCDKKLLFFKSHKEKGMEGMIEVIEGE